jgi:hypothetical protein
VKASLKTRVADLETKIGPDRLLLTFADGTTRSLGVSRKKCWTFFAVVLIISSIGFM